MGEHWTPTLLPTKPMFVVGPATRWTSPWNAPGEPKPLILHGVFRAAAPARTPEGLAKSSALQVLRLFPIPLLLLAFAVLFLRLEEPNAWLLALLFCAFAASAPL